MGMITKRKITLLCLTIALLLVLRLGIKSVFIDSNPEANENSLSGTGKLSVELTVDPEIVTTPSDNIVIPSPIEIVSEETPIPQASNLNQTIIPTTINNIYQTESPQEFLTKPTYEFLKSEADAKILALKNKAQSELLALVSQYQSSTDANEQAVLVAKGKRMLGGYDANFAGILGNFKSQLIENAYDTAIIAEYQQQYKQEKQIAQAFLGS